MITVECALCHAEKPHEARGLCHLCYELARLHGLLGGFPRGRRAPKAADRTAYWHKRYEEKRNGLPLS